VRRKKGPHLNIQHLHKANALQVVKWRPNSRELENLAGDRNMMKNSFSLIVALILIMTLFSFTGCSLDSDKREQVEGNFQSLKPRSLKSIRLSKLVISPVTSWLRHTSNVSKNMTSLQT
jgi:hypothetical protein